MIHHHKSECPVNNLDYCNQDQGYSEGKNVSVYPDDIFKTAQHFVTKLGIVTHHHELECLPKYWFVISKVKVTAKAHVIKIW